MERKVKGTGNREEGAGNREEGTGNREQGRGKREEGGARGGFLPLLSAHCTFIVGFWY